MRKTIYRILQTGICLLATACISEDYPQEGAQEAKSGDITIVIRLPQRDAASRANPVGGEEGNGREEAILNEGKIYDINLFFYEGAGINLRNGSDPTLTRIYVDKDSEAWTEDNDERKVIIHLNTADTGLGSAGLLNANVDVSFITVVNGGKDFAKGVGTLSALRKYKDFGNTWTANGDPSYAGNCDRFVMTTAYEANAAGTVSIGGSDVKVGKGRLERIQDSEAAVSAEWSGETTVERMCARIDVMYGNDNLKETGGGKELRYSVASGFEQPSVVHLTNILPVNIMNRPSYLLKKTTAGLPADWSSESGLGTINWAGVETSTGIVPSNWVIEPTTLIKASEAGEASTTGWYGETATTTVADRIKDATNGAIGAYYNGDLPAAEAGANTKMTVIGYANENIQAEAQYDSRFLTGLVMRGVYQPRAICRYADGILTQTEMTDQEWNALQSKSFTRYQPTVKNGNAVAVEDKDALYFTDYQEADRYAKSHPEELGKITVFTDGICYYNLWIRHFNDESADPQAKYPMEYAIVRNNIYRVSLSFSGPGDTTPTMREPDTMQARIFVRKWNLRKENTPLEF